MPRVFYKEISALALEVLHKNLKRAFRLATNQKIHKKQNWAKYTKEEKTALAALRVSAFNTGGGARINKKALKLYEEAIKLAYENNIKIILLKNPMPNELIAKIPAQTKQKIHKFLRALSTKYGVQTLDYLYRFKTHQEYFSDASHTNQKGAKIIIESTKNSLSL